MLKAHPKTARALLELQYDALFMRSLEEIAGGRTLSQILKEDMRVFEQGAFLRWITRDSERSRLFDEAKSQRSEFWAGETIEIADGVDSAEDVARSKLRIDTRFRNMEADNRPVYGKSTTVTMGGTISILGAMEIANSRVLNMGMADEVTDAILIEDNS